MTHLQAKAIVLRRVDYGEADRILTILTPEGSWSVLAKGVRRLNSRLAGGIELMSENELNLVSGRGELLTLTGARNLKTWPQILGDYDRLQTAYSLLKTILRVVERGSGGEFYSILRTSLESLNNELPEELVNVWFSLNLLKLSGHQPELRVDDAQEKLEADAHYQLEPSSGRLVMAESGPIDSEVIKLWRLCVTNDLDMVASIGGVDESARVGQESVTHFLRHQFPV